MTATSTVPENKTLPTTYEALWELTDQVIKLCQEFDKKAQRARTTVCRPRGYVPPVFPRAVAHFQPKERPDAFEYVQLEHNYDCALQALNYLLSALELQEPRNLVVGESILVQACFTSDAVMLVMPVAVKREQLLHDVAVSKKIVHGVDPQNFLDELLFALLVRKGYGVVRFGQTIELDTLLRKARVSSKKREG